MSKFKKIALVVSVVLIPLILMSSTYIKGPALIEDVTVTATAAGTTTLTKDSQTNQEFTGVTTQTVVLPDATTIPTGRRFYIMNRSTGTVTVNYNGGALAKSLPASSQATFILTNNGTSAGTWDVSMTNVTIVSGILPIANGGTNSGTALNNNRFITSSGGQIVENAAVTASRAVATDSNGLPVASATTATELGYVNGVTSSIQTQLDSKLPKGGGTLTGALVLNNGASASTPDLTWTGDLNTGLYSSAADVINFSAGGTSRANISSAGLSVATDITSQTMTATKNDSSTSGTINPNAFNLTSTAASTSTATLYALYGFMQGNSGQTLNTLVGVRGRARAASGQTGTVSFIKGGEFQGDTAGSNTIGNVYGLTAYGLNSSAGTVSIAYGIQTGVTPNSGTITTGYGLYIDTVLGATKYGLYQADTTLRNYFGGDLGIGVTAPTADLDLNGTFSITENTISTSGAIASLAPTTSTVRLTGTTVTIQGISAAADNNQIINIMNVTGSNLTIANQNGTASANDRIITGTGADIAIPDGAAVSVQYDDTTNRWRVIGPKVSSAPVITTYTSGSGTHNFTAGVLWVEVWAIGGGGGGAGSGTATGTAATAGTATTFAGQISAGGGGLAAFGGSTPGGTGGTATLGTGPVGFATNGNGGAGGGSMGAAPVTNFAGGAGGAGCMGGAGLGAINTGTAAATNSGAGGSGGGQSATANSSAGGGGGAGGCVYAILSGSFLSGLSGSAAYAVGAAGNGGAAGTSGAAGGNGAAGKILIIEHFN